MGKQLSLDVRDEAHRLVALRLTPTEVWEKLKAKRAQVMACVFVFGHYLGTRFGHYLGIIWALFGH